MAAVKPPFGAFLLDLDGTVYRGSDPITGASAFVNRLKEAAVPHLFVTNRANRTVDEVSAQLNDLGVAAENHEVLTSAQATARYLGQGSCYVIGEAGLLGPLEEEGLTLLPDGSTHCPDNVVVGYDRGITYQKLETAMRAILAGARFIATNPDPIITTEQGVSPENGAIVAALEAATGQRAEVIGKPERIIVDQAVAQIAIPEADIVMLGDNLETDVAAAQAAGTKSILILTGVSTREDLATSTHRPDWVVEDFDELTELVFGEWGA
ncbi:MAG: HAD-IIA family hydrolase [Pseudomonadota bacterium]